MGAALPAHSTRSVCSSYFYPQGQQLYLSRMPQEPKTFGATSVLQKTTVWMSFILPAFSRAPCYLHSPSFFMSHYLHPGDAWVMSPCCSSYTKHSEVS